MKKLLSFISLILIFCFSLTFYGFCGDDDESEYLGELSTNKYDPDSISNPYGKYGSKYSPNSINNPYGKYGSKYSPNSPTNSFATDPPQIHHKEDNLNQNKPKKKNSFFNYFDND